MIVLMVSLLIEKCEKQVVINEMVVDAVFCNKCGNRINVIHDYGLVPHDVFEDHLHAAMHYQFRGNGFWMEEFDLCSKCFDELIQTFVIPTNKV